MSSLDFETEKQRFLDYYNENHGLLDGAKNSFITLVNLLIRSSRIQVRSATLSNLSG